jgi:hypothetical protein
LLGLLALLGLVAGARVAGAVVGKLCRKWTGDRKGSGSENHPPARRLLLPPHTYKRPDPRIYSQAWLMARGLAVTWDNPDISLLDGASPASPHALLSAHAYVIQARLWNGSPEAPAVNARALRRARFRHRHGAHRAGRGSGRPAGEGCRGPAGHCRDALEDPADARPLLRAG